MNRRSKILVTGAIVGSAMTLALWLFHSSSSLAYEYSIWHPVIGNTLAQVNLLAAFLGTIASGNVHQPSEFATYLAVFVQWALLGAGLAWAVLPRSEGKGDA